MTSSYPKDFSSKSDVTTMLLTSLTSITVPHVAPTPVIPFTSTALQDKCRIASWFPGATLGLGERRAMGLRTLG